MRLVLATKNPGKVRELAALLAGLPVEVLSPAAVGVDALADETGLTFLENAVLKAGAVAAATGLAALADDSGLQVDALGGAPGVRSARYAGPAHDDPANTRRLLADLAGVADRRARFVCCAALVLPAGVAPGLADAPLPDGVARVTGLPGIPPGATALAAFGEVAGEILEAPRGAGGFGYDPVFRYPPEGRTFAEIPADRKNAFSHRGQAFRRIRELLERAG
jgi:XTP/dITP diphosphohydrolase